MKYIVASLLLLFSTSAFAGNQYLVKVEGMSCPFCAHGVEKKVKEMKGVASAEVDLKSSIVSVKMQDGIILPEADIKQAIADAGFSFKSIETVKNTGGDHGHKGEKSDGQP